MPPQVGDISAALAYQVKKEIAENYFGTRRELEAEREEIEELKKKIQKEWDRAVLPNLILIGQLLIGIEEIRAFLNLIKREDLIEAVQSALKRPGTDSTPAECAVPFALTAKGKYNKLIFYLYQRAKTEGDELGEEFRLWKKKADLFNEDLNKFSSNYQLSDILALVHSIEIRDDLKGVLGENIDPRTIPLLEEKLVLKPIGLDREEGWLQPLPPLKEVRTSLKLLLDQAFQAHCPEIKKMILAV
jgi:hypothetical protein